MNPTLKELALAARAVIEMFDAGATIVGGDGDDAIWLRFRHAVEDAEHDLGIAPDDDE